MPREYPTATEMLRQMVAFPTDVWTERGRRGVQQLHDYVRSLVEDWGLGDVTIQRFSHDSPYGEEDPPNQNLFIDVGKGDELGIWHGHVDSIFPDDKYKGMTRKPTQLTQSEESASIMYGCKSLDMASGVVAFLRALPELERTLADRNRHIRIALVTGEEHESEGTHAAKDMLKDGQWAVTTEITVGGNLSDPPCIIHARPGRAVFNVNVEGLTSSHLGALQKGDQRLLPYRFRRALEAVELTDLPMHSDHPTEEGYMPPSICYPNQFATGVIQDLTTANEAHIVTEVIYTNPSLELTQIGDAIRARLHQVLQGQGFSVELSPDRRTPWIKPWYEDPRHPLVSAAQHHAQEVCGRHVQLRSGRGTADENIIAHLNIPVVTFPPCGEGEHTNTERTDVDYIDRYMVPFLLKMAGTKRTITQW